MRRSNTWVAQRQNDKTCLLKRSMLWISAATILLFLIGGFVILGSVYSPKQEKNILNTTETSLNTTPTKHEKTIPPDDQGKYYP